MSWTLDHIYSNWQLSVDHVVRIPLSMYQVLNLTNVACMGQRDQVWVMLLPKGLRVE
jgi:hypothetical protein